jgi:hypothetical protein
VEIRDCFVNLLSYKHDQTHEQLTPSITQGRGELMDGSSRLLKSGRLRSPATSENNFGNGTLPSRVFKYQFISFSGLEQHGFLLISMLSLR